MIKRLLAILFIAVVAVYLTAAPASAGKHRKWRKVLSFDVLAKVPEHRADLGNHRLVVASWVDGLGWDIGVYGYPRAKSQVNLLYQGRNLHGIQPWMAFAWAKHEKIFPDVREMPYDGGKSHLRIVLAGCETRPVGNNAYEFSKGRIEVFHKP